MMLRAAYRLAIFAILTNIASAEPIAPGAVQVIDGDTIRTLSGIVRLVGFDTPEAGERAQCESERMLAARATFRLRQLVAGGALDLRLVPCACQSGTEGTRRCNYGRACGVLLVKGRDVGATLRRERLARTYLCGTRSCPRREPWC